MKTKLYTYGITFFVSQQMYERIKTVSNHLNIGMSDFMRQLIEGYFQKIEAGGETESKEDDERK